MAKDEDAKQQSSGSSIERTLLELKQSMDSMHNKFDTFRQELSAVQDKVRDLENGQVELAGKVSVLETTSATKDELSACQLDVKEELDRIRRASNLMIFGVEETEDGMRIADAVLRLLLPHRQDHFVMIRQITKASNKPRPLMVLLNNQGERTMALSNKKMLKGKPEYKAISVQPDRTKIQRTVNAEKYRQKKEEQQGEEGKDLTNGRVLRSQGKRNADQMNKEGTEAFVIEPQTKVARKESPLPQSKLSSQDEVMEEVD